MTESDGDIILFQTEDGRTRLEVRLEGGTVWLSQALMAELYQATPQNITQYLKAVYDDGENAEAATCKESLQVRNEGGRQVRRTVKLYSLDAILAVGSSPISLIPFRGNISTRHIHFRARGLAVRR